MEDVVKIHTVFITYNRLELTKVAIDSYLQTVCVSYDFWVVDNGSQDGTKEWLLQQLPVNSVLLPSNRYPGFATNLGWSEPNPDITHLHRADNDFKFLPGWCEEVERMFSENERLGQLGLRTDEEELFAKSNVGGNCVIRRDLWDLGLRWDERPWPQLREEVGPGHTEDSLMSPAVKAMNYSWDRVERPCIQSLSRELPDDPDFDYYRATWADRGIAR
jgi:glycosyltransferase involved in cell wall biosynthesis